jgi:hypothetical protein
MGALSVLHLRSEDGKIVCKGGFSDGTGAEGVTLDVIAYDENILVPGKFGSDSVVRFEKPPGEFYVLFDAGPGHVVEVDWRDIEGLAPWPWEMVRVFSSALPVASGRHFS